MNSKKNILTILFIFALFYLTACSSPTTPSPNVAEKYFIEQCVVGVEVDSLSDFRKNALIKFEILNESREGDHYELRYRAEIEYLIDGYSFRKGLNRYAEGIIFFIKDEKGWSPQNATIYGHECSHKHYE